MIYLLTAIGLPPGGSSTVHIYTQTIHRTIQNKQYIEQHNLLCIVRDFFFNNQPDAPIIQTYSFIKLCMFRASSVPIIRSALL